LSRIEEKIDVKGDGRVILYKRHGLKDPKWQARIRVPNSTGYKVVSTKTADQREAERFALGLYEDLYIHVKQGGSVKSKTFRQVFEEWSESSKTMASTRQGGSWEATVDRVKTYALTYFDKMRVDAIKPSDFTDFWHWRKTHYNKKVPSNATLKRERACLLPLFKFAMSKGYITKLPEIDPPKAKLTRRPTFTPEEWKAIYTKARHWVNEGKQKATYRDRFVAWQVFLILANTGMRVGELRGLRWSDLRTVPSEDGNRLIGNVRGKTGAREVVFQGGADTYVKRLYDLRRDELEDSPERDGLVICHKDGSAIVSFKTGFRALLTYAKVPEVRDGMSRTIYSLRHFYATQRLSHEASPFLLAKQMGTSVEMLEKFYGHTVTSALAAQVTKRNQMLRAKASDQYPFE
jgi:integrase